MDLFSPVRLTPGGRPVLSDNEIELVLSTPCDLYDGATKKYTRGVAMITSKRLIYQHTTANVNVSLDLAAFVRSLSSETPFFGTPKVIFTTVNGAKVMINFPANAERDRFRAQADHALTDARATAAAAAKKPAAGSPAAPGAPPVPAHPSAEPEPEPAAEGSLAARGIAGILARREAERNTANATLAEAFSDLSSLMANAQRAVQLAERLQAKSAAASAAAGTSTGGAGSGAPSASQDGTAAALLDAALSLGIASPVTRAGAGAAFHEQLSRQLVDVLAPVLPRAGGSIALPDAYLLVSRARGSELVSPEDFLAACRLWAALRLPLALHTFPATGVVVVTAPGADAAAVAARILALLREPVSASATAGGAVSRWRGLAVAEIAEAVGVTVSMARECVREMERGARSVVRDEGDAAVRYYANQFW